MAKVSLVTGVLWRSWIWSSFEYVVQKMKERGIAEDIISSIITDNGSHFSDRTMFILLVLQHLSEIMITPHIRVFTIKQIVITDIAQNSYWMVRQNQSM